MKINDRIVGGVTAVALMGAIGLGGFALVAGANATPPAVDSTPVLDLGSLPDTNGLAAEQEAEAAAAEAARIAAEAAAAEAARVAAEQAAAAEAQRIADEQAAAEAEAFEAEEPSDPAPEPEPEEFTGPAPGTQVHTICQVLEDGTQVPCQH